MKFAIFKDYLIYEICGSVKIHVQKGKGKYLVTNTLKIRNYGNFMMHHYNPILIDIDCLYFELCQILRN